MMKIPESAITRMWTGNTCVFPSATAMRGRLSKAKVWSPRTAAMASGAGEGGGSAAAGGAALTAALLQLAGRAVPPDRVFAGWAEAASRISVGRAEVEPVERVHRGDG